MTFSLDTSFFIEGWRNYPPEIFPSVWMMLANQIDAGELVAIKAVQDELEVMDDSILKWTESRRQFYHDYDGATWQTAQQLMARFPGMAKARRDRTAADVFVIAFARTFGHTVVTYEGNKRDGIPRVCNEINVPCITVVELLRQLGFSC